MPKVTLTARPPQGGFVVDPVTLTRWSNVGESHVVDDPAVMDRLASTASHGYAFEADAFVAPAPVVPDPAPAPAPADPVLAVPAAPAQ